MNQDEILTSVRGQNVSILQHHFHCLLSLPSSVSYSRFCIDFTAGFQLSQLLRGAVLHAMHSFSAVRKSRVGKEPLLPPDFYPIGAEWRNA